MSDEKELQPRSSGYTPARPSRLTVDEVGSLAQTFKQISDSTTIKWSIYAAGGASVLEILHIFWLAARFVFRF